MKTAQALDVARLRQDFPALALKVHGKPLVYLDNAATSQKPRAVLDAERTFYETMNANVHRGVHTLSERATEAYEGARGRIARFVGARDAAQVVWTRGTTEAVNLVAWSFVRPRLAQGRRDRGHAARAPLEHRAVAAPVRGDRRAPPGRADRRHGRGDRRGLRAARRPARASSSRRSRTCRTRSGRSCRCAR